METNYLGTSPVLQPKAPITIIHPGNSFIQCSPIGQPLVKGSVFRPKPMVKPTVVVEDTDTGTITTDDEFERALEDNIWVDTSFDPYNKKHISSHNQSGLLMNSPYMVTDTEDEEDETAPSRPPPPAWETSIIRSEPGPPQKNPPTPPPRAHPLKMFNFPSAPPAPPPRFSSTGRASTLPRPAGSKAPERNKKHVSKIHCMINFEPSAEMDHITRTKGYSASLPRNMGRMKNKESKASILINSALSKESKPTFHRSDVLPVAPEEDILMNFSNGFLSSTFPSEKTTNGLSHLTSEDYDELEDDFYIPPAKIPPLHKYNGILKSEQYRNIIAKTGKSATLPRSFSHGNMPSTKKKPIQRSASPLVLMPVSPNSQDPMNHTASLTLFSRPKTDLGWSTPQLQRSSKLKPYVNGFNSSQSSHDLRSTSPIMNGQHSSFLDTGRTSPFPWDRDPSLPLPSSTGKLSPYPTLDSGRVSPYLAEMERKLQLTPELGRKSPFTSGFTGSNSPFMDESGRLSPYPTDTSRGPSPVPDGRESPMPTQQGRIIRVFHAPGKAFTQQIESPFLSGDDRVSPFQYDSGRMSPFPLDNDYMTTSPHYTKRTSPYAARSMPDMARFGEQNGTITGDLQQYASGPIPYDEMDYDNLESFQTIPSLRHPKPVVSQQITRVTDTANLDDYDNLDSATSRPYNMGTDSLVGPGRAVTVKHDKYIDNPHFPNADDPRRRSLIWVKGYSTTMSLGGEICTRCGQGFSVSEEIVKCNGESWHTRCFVDKKEKDHNVENGLSVKNGQGDGEGAAPTADTNGNIETESDTVKAPKTNGFHGSVFYCEKCEQVLDKTKSIVNYNGHTWHPQCFVCAQCFQPFPDGIFYEFEGRKYCEHDFHVLFAPCCGRCREFIVGRVIKAMNANWHPDCFQCELCSCSLADAGFIKNAGRALCRECNAREKALGMGKYVCHKCHSIIDEGHIKYKGEPYHPYHFNCTTCSVELNADAREKGGELYCLRCHDKMGIPICGACRRPIEERVVHALGKAWHVEHFVCAKCEKPFLGHRHYEKKGLAYCETHYHQLFGNICFVCNNVISGDVFSALNKSWCVHHFACSVCDRKMSQNTSSGLCGFSGGDTVERKSSRYCGLYRSGNEGEFKTRTKFFEYDLKPVCKSCYDHFPGELKKRLKKAYDASPKK